MIVGKAKKRRDGKSSFLTLLAYTTTRDDHHHDDVIDPETQKDRLSQSKEAIFERLMGYIHRNGDADKSLITERFSDGRHQVLFDQILCETNTLSVATAAVEMQSVALKIRVVKIPFITFFYPGRRRTLRR